MPRSTPDENFMLLYAIIQCSGNATIDWEHVGRMTGMTKGAAYGRYFRLKKSFEAEVETSTAQPRPAVVGRKRKGTDVKTGETKKCKVEKADGAAARNEGNAFINEDGDVDAEEVGGDKQQL